MTWAADHGLRTIAITASTERGQDRSPRSPFTSTARTRRSSRLHQAVMHARGPVRPSVANDRNAISATCAESWQPLGPRVRGESRALPYVRRNRQATHARGDQPLTENPETPSAPLVLDVDDPGDGPSKLESGEETALAGQPESRHLHQGYGPNVFYITYPWSKRTRNCAPSPSTSNSPVRLPLIR